MPPPTRPIALVVEDEPILLLHAIDLAEDAGLDALSASNTDQALVILESRDDIALLMVDIVMPGTMDGWKLAAYVRDRWPPIPIIVTSAYRNIAASDMPERSRFIRKPFQSAAMISAMQNLVAGGPTS